MARSAGTPEKLNPAYADDVSVLLGYVDVPKQVCRNYVDFLDGQVDRLTTDIQLASISLGRLYVASLNYPVGESYENGEQTMTGLVIGRTVRERPQPVEVAAEQYILHYNMLDEDKIIYVHMFSSGIAKLRYRVASSPRLREEAEKRLAHAFSLEGIGRPSWYKEG